VEWSVGVKRSGGEVGWSGMMMRDGVYVQHHRDRSFRSE
jgi:hypothetical protein